MSKMFTLGEIATIITGLSLAKRDDPLAKELVEYISGEPANELTYIIPSPNRIDYCREWLLKTVVNLPPIETLNGDTKGLNTTFFEVSPHNDFPAPPSMEWDS